MERLIVMDEIFRERYAQFDAPLFKLDGLDTSTGKSIYYETYTTSTRGAGPSNLSRQTVLTQDPLERMTQSPNGLSKYLQVRRMISILNY